MPIFCDHVVLVNGGANTTPVAKPLAKEEVEVETPTKEQFQARKLASRFHHSPSDSAVLIVDGKEKRVSKSSGYLLDMLSLD